MKLNPMAFYINSEDNSHCLSPHLGLLTIFAISFFIGVIVWVKYRVVDTPEQSQDPAAQKVKMVVPAPVPSEKLIF